MSFVSDDLKLLIRSQRASSLDSANENNESFGKEAADPNHILKSKIGVKQIRKKGGGKDTHTNTLLL